MSSRLCASSRCGRGPLPARSSRSARPPERLPQTILFKTARVSPEGTSDSGYLNPAEVVKVDPRSI